MKIDISFRNLKYKLNKREIKCWVENIWELLPSLKTYTDILEVSVVLTDNNFIKRLNREYRGKDSFTDVIAFPQIEAEFFKRNKVKNCYLEFKKENWSLHLGDIVISVDEATKNAKRLGHSLKQEIKTLIVHGLLHLLGYQDETTSEQKIMMAKQRRILKGIESNEGD